MNNIHTVGQNMSCCNIFLCISFQLRTCSILSLKITSRNIKYRYHRFKVRHWMAAQKLITWYLIPEIATLHVSHLPSFIETNVCDGRCHCETRFTQYGIAFTGAVISKLIDINIKINKVIRVFFQKTTKISIKMLYYEYLGNKW